MKYYINFFWAGKRIPKKIRVNIRNWGRVIFRNNLNYILILWLDNFTYKSVLDDQKQEKLCKIYPIEIRNFDEIIGTEKSDYLLRLYMLFIESEQYAFASDIARMLTLNKYPGIYLDMDVNPGLKTLPNPDELQKMSKISTINFLAKGREYSGCYRLESEILFFMGKSDGLNSLIATCRKESAIYFHYIQEEIRHMQTFYKSNDYIDFNKSLFKEEKYKKHLIAFKEKSHLKYRMANKELFKDVKYNNAPAFQDGTAPWVSYQQLIFYEIITECEKTLKVDIPKYYHNYYKEHLDKCFSSGQDNFCLYSWNDPGYSRLTSLDNASKTIGKYFRKKREKFIDQLSRPNVQEEIISYRFKLKIHNFIVNIVRSMEKYQAYKKQKSSFLSSNFGINRTNILINQLSAIHEEENLFILQKKLIFEFKSYALQKEGYEKSGGLFKRIGVNPNSSMTRLMMKMYHFYHENKSDDYNKEIFMVFLHNIFHKINGELINKTHVRKQLLDQIGNYNSN
ncbi:hypothetical protein IB643_06130 [Allofrancisella guangzhouensis]|uniref:glycosyltransferase n=1 Tax=Allofrancisella guangzhouensis TaxID=594679 RepID=UPI001F44F758|nr:glycosyltransferase [Allofrancisella guangzhouensis]MBK2027730.1 hypothetical protein [Allofrancisella guangzhouensis]